MGLTRPRAEQIYNLDYKQATRVVTVANITLSGGAPAVVDGVSLSINDRVLVTGQTTASQNGIYDVVSVGTGSNGTWSRTSDANATGEIEAGMIIMVTEGIIYADTQWKLITDNPIVIGTTGLVFTQNYMANSISSGSSNVVVYSNAAVTISSGGTPNVVVISTTGQQVTGQISATGNISGNYFIGNGSQLTGLAATYSNANVTSLLAAFGSNTISTTGTVTTGNLLVNGSANIVGNLSVQGNITYINSNVIVTNDLYIALANNQSTYAGIDGAGFQVGNSGSGTLTNWTYSTVANAWTTNVSVSVTGNISGAYVLGNGSQLTGLPATYSNANVTSLLDAFGSNSISTTGNITSGYLFGNGSQLTGVITSSTSISNGNSNVSVVSVGGNVTVGVDGTSNVAQFSNTGLLITGTVSATGNIAGNYFIGNGSQLTGISGGGTTVSGNLSVLTRTATILKIPVISSYLTVLSRSGNIAIPVGA
jgi:hypothetical protein